MGIEIGLTLRLDLGAVARGDSAGAPPGVTVREVARDELASLLGDNPALMRAAGDLDLAAPNGWRCFVAAIDGRPRHVSFVETRPGRPLLFGAVTEPTARGRGLFAATVRFIAAALARDGVPALWSSVAGRNRPSVRAHRAAGFRVVRRTFDLRVAQISLRALAGRLVRGA
ncbi:MAG TPA: hypothetical protein VN962_18560 [Polyangia bacterium]|nr:hypothetical protein [Polyangia bacterium]